MASRLQVLAALASTALGLPSPIVADPPVRILPFNWDFKITALDGPGCPDFGQVNPPFTTRPTFGSNTVDGSEIYYWHFAYPHFRASVGPETPEASIWCETTLSYTELNSEGVAPEVPEYRLQLHKNGTEFLASYDLEEGVEAKWKVTYLTEPQYKIDDELTVTGPRAAGAYHDYTDSQEVQWRLPQCGTGTIRYRTELTLKAKKEGASGTVSSEKVQYAGRSVFYGVQQGVSYDWSKCDL
ncbi:hypothetical protein C8A00DRAFT_41367 [Chaetomidium leptoderma]|uniref:Uncharacterized protein n=1 Tax=Chaetomidium leptoderma TaxID=669021 RepID=A0AAN7A0U0_9PEZI|nr:hypothetical protein C8A00DRAFT_41367 [Chaetomidium leptoderma]